MLAEVLAAGVYAFAVMSNHVHVVAYLDPEVAWGGGRRTKWRPAGCGSSRRKRGRVDVETTHLRARAMAGNAARIAVCRARLASLSWFMRCLSEPIARRANREDACSGRCLHGLY